MSESKLKQLVQIMMIQSKYFDNFIAKFNFVTMLDYLPRTEIAKDEDLIITSPSSNTLYLLDITQPHKYLKTLIKGGIFPVPIFHHIWHERGIVGSDEMYNKICDPNLYLQLTSESSEFEVFCFVFDGERYPQVEIPITTYDNRWQVDEEMLPPLAFLNRIGIEKIKLMTDDKRSDLIIAATNLYEEAFEIEVI